MIQDFLNRPNKDETKWWISNTLAKKVKKDPSVSYQEVEHIVDYLNSDAAPKRFQKMDYITAKQKSLEWVEKLRKKASEIAETEQDTKSVLKFKDGFRLVRLVGESAYKREGYIMKHCVASYYGKETKIYSLRDQNNEPHATFEVTGSDQLQQIKGKGNGHIHPKYIQKVIRCLKRLGKTVNPNDMVNLGYVEVSPYLKGVIDKTVKNPKYLNMFEKTFFYKNA